MNQPKQNIAYAGSILILLLLLTLTACDQSPTNSEVLDPDKPELLTYTADHGNSKIGSQLAELRRATSHYHDYEKAVADGYIPTDECVELPGAGGMGYHFVNPSLFGPPEALDITKPQAILYEPQKNGRLRQIGVEYIVPELILDSNGPAPMILGEHFHWNPNQKLWALHVWVWRNNPTGMFADWNPKVNCDYAP